MVNVDKGDILKILETIIVTANALIIGRPIRAQINGVAFCRCNPIEIA